MRACVFLAGITRDQIASSVPRYLARPQRLVLTSDSSAMTASLAEPPNQSDKSVSLGTRTQLEGQEPTSVVVGFE